MILILTQVALISNYEASKVANFFVRNGAIQVQHFEEYYRKCVQIQALNSASVQRLIYLAKNQFSAESLARHMIAQDLDKNGMINLDGLKASLLVTEFGFRSEDVQEIFLYLS